MALHAILKVHINVNFSGNLVSKAKFHDMKRSFPPETHWQFDQMASKNEDDSRELLLVSCWFLEDGESERMWQEYGKNNEAVAIQSTVRQLFQNIGVPHDR